MPYAPFPELFRRFYSTLESLGCDYFAYGGVAVGVWGDPRETQDVDAVVTVDPDGAARVLAALVAAGFHVRPQDATTFPIDGWLRAEWGGRFADLAMGRTPFDESALHRRIRMSVLGQPIWVVSAEDLVLYKLMAYRHKDLGDAEAVITRQRAKLDRAYLRSWAQEIAVHSGKFEIPAKLEDLLDRASRA